MNKYAIIMSLSLVPFIQACDIKDPTNKPKTEARTMIIGGVPVHDRDFKITQKTMLVANIEDVSHSSMTP